MSSERRRHSWLVVALAVALTGCAGEPESPSGPDKERAPDTSPPKTGGSTITVTVVPEPTVTVETTDLGDMEAFELTVDPPGATFVDTIEVTLAATEPGVAIYYTDDGSLPTAGGARTYTGPIVVQDSTLIRAVSVVQGQELHGTATFLELEAATAQVDSNLPQVVLWSNGPAPDDKEEEYEPFTLSTFEPAASGRVTWPATASLSVIAGLKVRGSSSAGYPKKPYRVEAWDPSSDLQEDLSIPLLGMPEDGDWVLLAPLSFDRALMRNALMYNLSNAVGRYAARTRFAEVFVAENGERLGGLDYQGVYVVVERVERGPDRVDITALLAGDVQEPELSGGYLFKEDRTGPGEAGFTAGTAGGVFDFEQPFVAVDPGESELEPEQSDYLVALLDELGDALASADFIHPDTGRHYDEIIDVDSWIDHHILNVFAKNPDAFRLSGYFHKDRLALLHSGPIWDFDRTMGCDEDSRAEDPTWWDPTNETGDATYVFEHGFWLGLFRDPVFRSRYWARWEHLIQGELSEAAIFAVIDGFAVELEEAAPRNYAAWPSYAPRGGSLESEVDLLKDWISWRLLWVEGCLQLADPRTCPGSS